MLDSYRLAKWVIQTLAADSALQTLLGGSNRVYSDIVPRDVTRTPPKAAVVVTLVSSTEPRRPLKVGKNTQAYTPARIQTTVQQEAHSWTGLKAVLDRIIAILDGEHYITGSDVDLFYCYKADDGRYVEVAEGTSDVQYRHWWIDWHVGGKATA